MKNIIGLLFVLCLVACSCAKDNLRALVPNPETETLNLSPTDKVLICNLPIGQKLVSYEWKEGYTAVWVLTRHAKPSDTAETYTLLGFSRFKSEIETYSIVENLDKVGYLPQEDVSPSEFNVMTGDILAMYEMSKDELRAELARLRILRTFPQ